MASPLPSHTSRPEALNHSGLVTASSLSMNSIHAKNVWVGFDDDFLHPGMPPPALLLVHGMCWLVLMNWAIADGGDECVLSSVYMQKGLLLKTFQA